MPQIEKRKIIRIGKTSLAVILPKAWLSYFSLQAGDKVELISNGHITIIPLAKTKLATKDGTSIIPKEATKYD